MDVLATGLAAGYHAVGLNSAEMAMFDFAIKLTKAPDAMAQSDIATLRQHAFNDEEIHEIVEVVACFNYFNRLTNSLGVALEPEWT